MKAEEKKDETHTTANEYSAKKENKQDRETGWCRVEQAASTERSFEWLGQSLSQQKAHWPRFILALPSLAQTTDTK